MRTLASEACNQGAIAQLGERLLCKQEVVGSIPSGSTITDQTGYRQSAQLKETSFTDIRATGYRPREDFFPNLYIVKRGFT